MENNKLQLFNFKGNNFAVILINGEPHWIAKDVCDYLELSNTSVALQGLKEGTQKKYIVGDVLSQLKELPNLNLGSRTSELNLLTEAGVYKLIFKSRKPNAEDFTDWISEEVLPIIRKTGKFDSIEEKIKLIEDEQERKLTLSVYSLEQVLKVNPNDTLTVINYNQTKQQLDSYRQQKQLELQEEELKKIQSVVKIVKEEAELIKQQQLYVCDRTNFNEKMKILANKYFGRDIQEAYNQLYDKMNLLGSFDVMARRKNEHKALNDERQRQGQKKYSASTLKSKISCLDIIDKYDKWTLCSEAYKTIEMEGINNINSN